MSQVTKSALMSGEQVPSGGRGALSPDEQLVRLTGRSSASVGSWGICHSRNSQRGGLEELSVSTVYC